MAKYYQFDGWFFNIEADVRDERDAFAMIDFLSYLKGRVSVEVEGALVLW